MTLESFLRRVVGIVESVDLPYMLTGSLAAAYYAIDPESGWKVDWIVRRDRPFSIEEFERRRRVETMDLELSMVTPEDLVVATLEWEQVCDETDPPEAN